MTRSLRSRLIVGMFLGMSVLLIAADVTIYTVQRRQLYRAFDETLLSSAHALALLFRPSPFGVFFDSLGLSNLPAGRIRQGALYQFWSDRPIHVPPLWPDPNFGGTEESATRPSHDDRFLPKPHLLGWDEPHGPPPGRSPGESTSRRPGWGQNGDAGPTSRGAAAVDTRPSPDDRTPPWIGFPGPGGPMGPHRGGPPAKPPDGGPMRVPDGLGQGVFVVRSPLLNGADLRRLNALPGQPLFERIALPGGVSGRAVGLRFQLSGPDHGPRRHSPTELTAVVAASTTEMEKQLSFLAALLAATGLATLTISGGVAWLVVSRGLRPLAGVARKLAAMDEKGLKQRIPDHGVPREIEPLVSQLNGLLGRLDQAFDRERTLTADVAHELRTPVAEIRAIAEVTLSRLRDPEEYRQALGDALDTARTLQALIEKLLVLARLEGGQTKPELEPVALKPLLARHWEQGRKGAESRGITFEDRCPPDVIVSADLRLVEVALSNVLFNAAAYTPDGGRITAAVEYVGTRCRLSISNTGCELSEAEAAKVFDRFWRADAARSGTGLHCGLGLTLVRHVMEVLGGRAEAGVSQDRRFVLTLTFNSAES